jgi:hypothetical protein
MNKRQVISSLNKIAEELDNNRFYTEASTITNVMKKLAQTPGQAPQAPQDLTKKVQVSMGIADNLYKIFKNLESKYENTDSDFSSASLGITLTSIRNLLNRTLANLMMQPNKYNENYIASNYSPTSLPELRNYVSNFYKTEVQNYSSNDSMIQYLNLLGKFTNSAVSILNSIALNKPIPKQPNLNAEDSTEEPTQV